MSDFTTDNAGLIRANTSASAINANVNENTVETYANLFYPYILDNGGNAQIISLTIDVMNKEVIWAFPPLSNI